MKDAISSQRILLLHPKARPIFKSFVEEAENTLGVVLRISQGLRTIAEQDKLYAQGRTTPGKIVTNAKGGTSFHNYGLAIDLVELKNGQVNWNFDYPKLLPFAKKQGIFWGGNFKTILDKPHFQIEFGYTIQQLLAKFKKKDFISNTTYLNL